MVTVSISDLKLNPDNPRVHRQSQIRKLAKSIQRCGFTQPVLIDENRRVIAGHGRIAAAKLLSLNDVPTICIPHLSEPQFRALSIADNRLAQQATWNKKMLAKELKALSEVELNFDLELTGFEIKEIDLLIEGLSPAREEAPDSLATNEVMPVSRPGDVWRAGKHRLYCGDALDETSFSCLMEGQKADVVFVDPPYQTENNNVASDSGKANDPKNPPGGSIEPQFESLTQTCRLLTRHSVKGSVHYVFTDWRYIEEVLVATNSIYSDLTDLCVWNKGLRQAGRLYAAQHELVFVFRNGTASLSSDLQSSPATSRRANVWEYRGLEKPVSLVGDAIDDSTVPGQIVLDPFVGRDTTLIAAEKTDRICYGMEICPRKMDAALRRWQKLTGVNAIRSSSKRTLNP